jgi:hypothetical protein
VISIGCRYVRPPRRLSEDEVRIQRLFIDPVTDTGHRVAVRVGAVLLGVLLVLLVTGRL